MCERNLYLVRHGQLDLGAFAKDQFTAGLTPLGREQARFTAKRFRALDVKAIYSSTLGRARETADIIAEEFPGIVVRATALLWELQSSPRAIQRGKHAFSFFVRPTRQRQRIEIVVSHGNLIRYFACRVLGIDPESWSRLGTSHCGITQLCIGPQKSVRVVCYNETGHLPTRLRT